MVESFLAVPLHFTVEFLGFLVFAGGAFLVISRPGLIPGETSNRAAVTAGFVLLAAGQVAHGGSFRNFEFDGARILLGVRTAGLVFVLIGVLGGLRAGAAAIAIGGWKIQEPLFFAPAGAAVLAAIAAFRGSQGSGPKSMRRLALAAFGSAEFTFASAAGGTTSGGTDPGAADDGNTITGGTGGGDGDGTGTGTQPEDPDDCADFASCAVQDIEDELPPAPGPAPPTPKRPPGTWICWMTPRGCPSVGGRLTSST